jgi:hypothetical protein
MSVRYEPFLAIPHRVFRDFRRGDLDRGRWHLLVDLVALAAVEDYSLQTTISYKLQTLADVIDFPHGEDKLRKDLNWLAKAEYIEVIPGTKSRPWQVTIGKRTRLEQILRQKPPSTSGQVEDDSQPIPGQPLDLIAQNRSSPNGSEAETFSDDSQPIPGQFTDAPVKTESESDPESNLNSKPEPASFEIPELLDSVSEPSPRGGPNWAITTLLKHLDDADRNTYRTLANLRLPAEAYLEAGQHLRRSKLTEHIRSDSGFVVAWLRDWTARTAA